MKICFLILPLRYIPSICICFPESSVYAAPGSKNSKLWLFEVCPFSSASPYRVIVDIFFSTFELPT